MAQLAEQLICNQQVFGSSPNIGSLSISKKYFDSSVQACLVKMEQKYFFIVRSTRRSNRRLRTSAMRCERLHCKNYYFNGRFPERPKGADCKSVALCFGGSNPPPSSFYLITRGGAVWKLVGLITRRS